MPTHSNVVCWPILKSTVESGRSSSGKADDPEKDKSRRSGMKADDPWIKADDLSESRRSLVQSRRSQGLKADDPI